MSSRAFLPLWGKRTTGGKPTRDRCARGRMWVRRGQQYAYVYITALCVSNRRASSCLATFVPQRIVTLHQRCGVCCHTSSSRTKPKHSASCPAIIIVSPPRSVDLATPPHPWIFLKLVHLSRPLVTMVGWWPCLLYGRIFRWWSQWLWRRRCATRGSPVRATDECPQCRASNALTHLSSAARRMWPAENDDSRTNAVGLISFQHHRVATSQRGVKEWSTVCPLQRRPFFEARPSTFGLVLATTGNRSQRPPSATDPVAPVPWASSRVIRRLRSSPDQEQQFSCRSTRTSHARFR